MPELILEIGGRVYEVACEAELAAFPAPAGFAERLGELTELA